MRYECVSLDLISTKCLWVQHLITLPRVTHLIKHNRIPYTPTDTCILQHSHYYQLWTSILSQFKRQV
ncbi:hypothetical protein HanXRQr2_Chr05g0198611 [Helianthus annuus]|uniref:Uncharacterized protein n=1 Tax=Helianthus annuus TaxID=4232 RepID=A0A9K3IXN7_HELAN|nr:hypothetical protein HanXRQr2_Chr05g0198611 [Helianthus annuus]